MEAPATGATMIVVAPVLATRSGAASRRNPRERV
jgi:hypothetical protein